MEFLEFFLLFSNDILLMIVANLIYIFSKKDDYKFLILLLLFVMILKTLLKDIFKIPPPANSPSSNYAFPSGHVYFATVFYLWIAAYKRSLYLVVAALIILTLTSFAIVLKNYHGVLEIMLTFLLGIFTVFVYNKLSKFISGKEGRVFLFSALILYMLSFCIFEKVKIDAIIGTYGTLGFTFGLFLNKKYINLLIPIIGLIICQLLSHNIEGIRWFFIFLIPPFVRFVKDKHKCRD